MSGPVIKENHSVHFRMESQGSMPRRPVQAFLESHWLFAWRRMLFYALFEILVLVCWSSSEVYAQSHHILRHNMSATESNLNSKNLRPGTLRKQARLEHLFLSVGYHLQGLDPPISESDPQSADRSEAAPPILNEEKPISAEPVVTAEKTEPTATGSKFTGEIVNATGPRVTVTPVLAAQVEKVVPTTSESLPVLQEADLQQAKSSEEIAPSFEALSDPLLISGKLSEIWKLYAAEDVAVDQNTWTLNGSAEEPVLICTGKPYGYLRTHKRYSNFEFRFEWQYPQKDSGNSGVLLFTQDEDMIWPQAIQVQLHHNKSGSVFPIGGAKSDQAIQVQQSSYQHDRWNECLIISQDGTVSVRVNGVKQGEITGCVPHSGHIALQSEGSLVKFRRVRIRDTKKVDETVTKEQTTSDHDRLHDLAHDQKPRETDSEI